ncbi:Zn-ribbon domain-containing OB-fold protein [Bradyrhizobium sp. 192]|uniref:Zn-ribbon domain-containing OB-fold protein n=1 Tax=Bradyrhizobium sp. 192 TaxID=2782660 RepID=UPI001FFF8B31|nr:Zn-ribbon domain-containing OB-fold protein [Bradyrhizobium sp. 192]UPJ59903.1 Zn-ribbon domain-containing OB-fold protein [Bradyrhizobium sp. 192]
MSAADFINNSPETKPFWDAAAIGRFVLPRCRECRRTHWYPRGFCPHCMSTTLDWQESPGNGEIHSFSVNRMGTEPYVLAYVALEEGPIMLTNVIDADPATLSIGTRVKLVFRPAIGQAPVPLFTIA